MSERSGAEELLQILQNDAEKLESLCQEFQCLLTEDQLEECSMLDFEPLTVDDLEIDGSEGLPSSDEEFLSSCNRNLMSSPVSSLTTSSSSSSSTSTARSFPSPLSSNHSQNSDYDDTPSAITAISLAKVLLTGTIPRLKDILHKHLENPSGTGPSFDEIREKYDTFQTVATEALRRFTVLRQKQLSQSNPTETES